MTLYIIIVNLNCEPLKQGPKYICIYGLFLKYILYMHLTTLYCTKCGSIMLNVIGTDYCKCRSQCVLVKQFRLFLLLRFAYSGVLLMTAFLKIYPIPKIRNIPIYRLSYSIEMYRIATPVS